jgi:nicotinamide-nucleotide amidase
VDKSDPIASLAENLVVALIAAGKTVATAESCTGGWIAKSITDVRGSSAAFGTGIVSYSDDAKQSLLSVDHRALIEHGAVSEQVVREMATGALARSGSDFAVAVSGIAGPDGGIKDKPVGTVWFAFAVRTTEGESVSAVRHYLAGDREAIRAQTVVLALQGLRGILEKHG